jgi:hypothetical protein
MEFHDNEHVYKVIPNVMGNAESDNPAIFHLKGISQDDFSEALRTEAALTRNHTHEEAAKLIAKNAVKLVSDRLEKIENLIIGGQEITTYEEFSKKAPRELVNWVFAAVHNTEILIEAEIKN